MTRQLSSALVLLAMVCGSPVSLWAQDVISRQIQAAGVDQLTIQNVAGTISVTGGNGRDVVIVATKRGDPAARDQVEVEIDERGSRIEIQTRSRRRRGRVAVDFEIQVPRQIDVSAESVSGDIVLTGITGVVRAETVSGGLEASELAALAQITSISGDIVLTDVSSQALEIESVSGSLRATGVPVRRLDVSTVSGAVTLEGVECADADLRSMSGTLRYEGALVADGRYELQSHSGEIALSVPEGSAFDLDASSLSGTIQSELPITTQGTGGRGRRTLRGRVAAGGARVDLMTYSGDISIEAR